MRRRWLLGGLAGFPVAADAQAPARMPTVGLLGGGTREIEADRVDVFKTSLANLGWKPGATLRLEEFYADGDATRIPELAAELVRQKPDVIACVGVAEAKALMAATREIPIVFIQVGDPQRVGLVSNIARPEGNVTGLTAGPQLYAAKCIELLVEVLGKPRRLGFLVNPGNPAAEAKWQDGLAEATRLGVRLERQSVRRKQDIEPALARFDGADGMFVQFDFLTFTNKKLIDEVALQRRLATVFEYRGYLDDGGLMSFGANLRENFRRAAGYVDRLLKGAKPSSLPVDEAARFELAINMRTAKALGLTIPPSILARADEVIE